MSLMIETRKMTAGPSVTLEVSMHSSLVHQLPPVKTRLTAKKADAEEKSLPHLEETSVTSSIVLPSDSDDEGEVQSKKTGAFGSLGSLEDTLPIKRGLSNHYIGKAKSFGDLSVVVTLTDLAKPDNPLNKRRRIRISNGWRKRSTSASSLCMPFLYEEHDDDEQVEKNQDRDDDPDDQQRFKFKSKTHFSLSDLQHRGRAV